MYTWNVNRSRVSVNGTEKPTSLQQLRLCSQSQQTAIDLSIHPRCSPDVYAFVVQSIAYGIMYRL
jgi:hypothetical protein